VPALPSYFIAGQSFEAPPLAAGLHVVSTPIGNLRDITIRALDTLAGADLVLCEDTRTSAKLLDHFGISTPRAPLHEHNERARIEPLVKRLADGGKLALISDAGTPLLSDPGFPLVRAVREAGLDVFAVPGPSALLAALAIAGLPTDSFSFHGFLPPKAVARGKAIAGLASRIETLAFYESPRRLADTLATLATELGAGRPAVVALELTKRFERLASGSLGELAAQYEADETRGEAVILVAGAPKDAEVDEADWQAALDLALADQPLRAAVDAISERFGLRRKQVYDVALQRKAGQ
jgi:16S rRNA (cytidine1402-2'-O)-methyltransferase